MLDSDLFAQVTDRLKAALGLTSDTALAEKLGLARTAFAERKRRGALPEEEIEALCVASGIDKAWAYTGKGKPRPGGAAVINKLEEGAKAVASLSLPASEARALSELLLQVSTGDRDRVRKAMEKLGLATVPRFDVAAAAGGGSVISVHDEAVADYLAFRPDWLREIGVSPQQLAVISVKGDSMEATLHDGDLILVDTTRVTRKMAGVYVIVIGEALLVKRLHFTTRGEVEIRSDNSNYPVEKLSGADFERLHIVGRMVRRVVR